jgi:hypothetical protein
VLTPTARKTLASVRTKVNLRLHHAAPKKRSRRALFLCLFHTNLKPLYKKQQKLTQVIAKTDELV